MSVEIFFDCGAPSLYNLLSRVDRKTSRSMSTHMRNWARDDFSYTETPEYKKYRREYAEFLEREAHNISIYSNLDVIHNAELTYKNQMWFEHRGLSPLPIWHLGSDISWLKRYLDEGYEYICLGGLVPNPVALLKPALDRLWREHLTDDEGMPLVKIHGFGMTSFDLMYRYPWFSVDSKSWVDYARFGFILVPPKKRDGGLDWLHPSRISTSNRSQEKRQPKTHFNLMSSFSRRHVLRFLETVDIPLGKTDYKIEKKGYALQKNELWSKKPKKGKPGQVEIIIEEGVMNSHTARMDVNLFVFKQIEQLIPQWPWPFVDKVHSRRKGLLI